jgi:hypothetical protein
MEELQARAGIWLEELWHYLSAPRGGESNVLPLVLGSRGAIPVEIIGILKHFSFINREVKVLSMYILRSFVHFIMLFRLLVNLFGLLR